jgi:hypothetical protein
VQAGGEMAVCSASYAGKAVHVSSWQQSFRAPLSVQVPCRASELGLELCSEVFA